ncbi:MAG: aminodeoxychorismate synthase component I [Desulfobacteraceae bacterium]|nr:MAG: aminodeoxychorismate synthase component I [Desulfobacteraceae bacterium]
MPAQSTAKSNWPELALAGAHVKPLELTGPFIDLAARFAHRPGTVVLLSGGELDCARYHLLGIRPWLSLCGRSGQMEVTVDGVTRRSAAPALDLLAEILASARLPAGTWPGPLAAGLMGYLAYDLKDEMETLPRTSLDDLGLPHMLLYAPSLLVVHDRRSGQTFLSAPARRSAECNYEALFGDFHKAAAAPIPDSPGLRISAAGLRSNFTQAEYQAAVQRVIDYIAAGDVYQVNLSQRFQVDFEGDAFALFRRLFELNPAPFFAFVQGGDHQIVSTSPERFLLQSGRRVESRPIKGTRPRGRTAAEDAAMGRELAESPKDDAELSMIVDLLRNDLGKVCRAGSVRVAEHKRLEAYQNVYHLVSIVEGELDAGQTSVDLIRAAFPGGSITGCPKVRAMEIIDELEPCRRHVYCGSIGYIGFDDRMDLSIAIRTAAVTGETLCFSVGGGIVFDSDPRAEYEETLQKGRTLAAACEEGKARESGPPAMLWCNGRMQPAAAAAVGVGDQGLLYGYGFFETIRVDEGRAPLLDDHLARFARTWQSLMPMDPPDLSWKTVIAQVVGANALQDRCAAVKLLATRGSRDKAPWDYALLVTARPYTHRLAQKSESGLSLGIYPHPRQTPLADHKTLNYLYYLNAGRWARANSHDEALILNPDGTVSETNTAALLVINNDEVIRPASAAVLPGVMAGAVCRRLAAWGYRTVERPLKPEALLSASQVLVANALMGAVPVIRIDGTRRTAGNDLWQRLNDEIIPGWRASL